MIGLIGRWTHHSGEAYIRIRKGKFWISLLCIMIWKNGHISVRKSVEKVICNMELVQTRSCPHNVIFEIISSMFPPYIIFVGGKRKDEKCSCKATEKECWEGKSLNVPSLLRNVFSDFLVLSSVNEFCISGHWRRVIRVGICPGITAILRLMNRK